MGPGKANTSSILTHDTWPEGRLTAGAKSDPSLNRNESKWWQRLAERLIDLNWSKADLSRRSGVPYDSVNKYLRGSVDKPRGDILDQLSRAVGRDARWLLFGDGSSPTISPQSTLVAKKLFPVEPPLARSIFVRWDELPRYSDLEIGIGRVSTQRRLLKFVADHRYFSVRVPDDSMAPGFRQDEILICEVDAVCKPDDYVIACVKLSRDVFFRRLEWATSSEQTDIQGALLADNPSYEKIIIRPANPVRIIGRIVGHLQGVTA